MDAFDEPAAQAVLDRLVSDLSVPAVLRDIVLPFLAELGQRWVRGTASIAQEHFASNLIRGRLAGLARGWGDGHGPRALLACPPGEMHDMALMIFGIALNRAGWRIDYFGADTPVGELTCAVHARPRTSSSWPRPGSRCSNRSSVSSARWPGPPRCSLPGPAPPQSSPRLSGPGCPTATRLPQPRP